METGNEKRKLFGVRRAVLCGLSALFVVTCVGCDYLGLSGDGSGDGQGEQQESGESSGEESSGKSASESSEDGDGAEEGDESETMERPPELAADQTETDAGPPKPKRNPFAPQVEFEEDEESEEEDTPDLGPLRKHPVGNYRLAGIISEVAVPKAMFIAPDGMGYQIKEGETIGQKGGVVKDIRRNEVDIEMPPDERENEPMVLTVELRKEALPGSGDDSKLTKQEREMLERLRAKQQGDQGSENDSTSDEEDSSEEVSEEGPEAAEGGNG